MTLWPVFVMDAMQHDDLRLFELGDVVTWPVVLIDAAAAPGWPADVGVEVEVTLGNRFGSDACWARTSELEVCAQVDGESGERRSIRAALRMDTFNPPWETYVTGTVRRIELVSVAPLAPGRPGMATAHQRVWMLSEMPVAPVRFRSWAFGDRSLPQDQGMLVHLEVFRPRCRCEEVGGLNFDGAVQYAARHLLMVERDGEGARYRCPDTGAYWRSRYETVAPDPGVPDHPAFPPRFVLEREDVTAERARVEQMMRENPGRIVVRRPSPED